MKKPRKIEGVNLDKLAEFKEAMPTINSNGVQVIYGFLQPKFAEWLAVSMPSGTIQYDILATNSRAKKLIGTVYEVLNEHSPTPSTRCADVFITRRDGITSHRDKDRTSTALICLQTTQSPLVYYYGCPVLIKLNHYIQFLLL